MTTRARTCFAMLLLALTFPARPTGAQVVNHATTLRATLRDQRVFEGQLIWSDSSAIRLRIPRSGIENTVERRDMKSVFRQSGRARAGAQTGAVIGGLALLVMAAGSNGDFGAPEGTAVIAVGALGGAAIGAVIGSALHQWVPITTSVSIRVRR